MKIDHLHHIDDTVTALNVGWVRVYFCRWRPNDEVSRPFAAHLIRATVGGTLYVSQAAQHTVDDDAPARRLIRRLEQFCGSRIVVVSQPDLEKLAARCITDNRPDLSQPEGGL